MNSKKMNFKRRKHSLASNYPGRHLRKNSGINLNSSVSFQKENKFQSNISTQLTPTSKKLKGSKKSVRGGSKRGSEGVSRSRSRKIKKNRFNFSRKFSLGGGVPAGTGGSQRCILDRSSAHNLNSSTGNYRSSLNRSTHEVGSRSIRRMNYGLARLSSQTVDYGPPVKVPNFGFNRKSQELENRRRELKKNLNQDRILISNFLTKKNDLKTEIKKIEKMLEVHKKHRKKIYLGIRKNEKSLKDKVDKICSEKARLQKKYETIQKDLSGLNSMRSMNQKNDLKRIAEYKLKVNNLNEEKISLKNYRDNLMRIVNFFKKKNTQKEVQFNGGQLTKLLKNIVLGDDHMRQSMAKELSSRIQSCENDELVFTMKPKAVRSKLPSAQGSKSRIAQLCRTRYQRSDYSVRRSSKDRYESTSMDDIALKAVEDDLNNKINEEEDESSHRSRGLRQPSMAFAAANRAYKLGLSQNYSSLNSYNPQNVIQPASIQEEDESEETPALQISEQDTHEDINKYLLSFKTNDSRFETLGQASIPVDLKSSNGEQGNLRKSRVIKIDFNNQRKDERMEAAVEICDNYDHYSSLNFDNVSSHTGRERRQTVNRARFGQRRDKLYGSDTEVTQIKGILRNSHDFTNTSGGQSKEEGGEEDGKQRKNTETRVTWNLDLE